LFALAVAAGVHADPGEKPWMNTALDADQRAGLVVAQMTREEKQGLVFAYFGTDAPWKKFTTPPEARAGSAG
jgi:beta-glucosidase